MVTETDVLAIVSDRLSAQGFPFMLTGSFALGYYATPRMTRDLDIVVALNADNVDALITAFSADFYVDADDVRMAIGAERLFNMMHFESGIKVDFIIRKSSAYREHEFSRRQQVSMGSAETWIVSREDLILSKLLWALAAQSELQERDVRQLLNGPLDAAYINKWAPILGVDELLQRLLP